MVDLNTAGARRERLRRRMALGAAVLGIALTARLGVWQLDRAAQKLALAERIAQRGAMPPLDGPALARDAAAAADQHQRRIALAGRWLAERTVYLDNRQMHGRPGFFVLTPLELAPGDAVLVQRGWIPRDARERTRLQPVVTPAGEVRLTGRVVPPPSSLLALGGSTAGEAGPIRQNLDLAAFAREAGVTLRPLSVQQTDDGPPGAAGDGLLRDWPAPAADVDKHYGYAGQWFALCALIAGLTLWFAYLRPRRRPPR